MVGVAPHLRRQVKGHRQAGLPLLEQIAVALVRLLSSAKAGVLAHGPEPAAVHGGLDAAGKRVLTREVERFVVVEVSGVRRGVQAFDLSPRGRLEAFLALG